MTSLLLDLSDWYHIGKIATELINPNTYYNMSISLDAARWIITKGGYLICWMVWYYPSPTLIIATPWLLHETTRYVIMKITKFSFNLTAIPFRYIYNLRLRR